MPIKFRYVEGQVTAVDMAGAAVAFDVRVADGSTVTVYAKGKRNQNMVSNWYGSFQGMIGARVRFQVSDSDEILGVG